MINIEGDFGPMTEALDITDAMTRIEASGRLKSKAAIAASIIAASGFNAWLDAKAESSPETLHHVYEWKNVGNPNQRLWNIVMAGRGNNRIINYVFTPSNTFVPAGKANTGISGDTRKQVHIFRWKAPVLENGSTVRIAPINGKFLAFPSSVPTFRGRDVGGMMFRTGPIIERPGTLTRGQFGDAWMTYFTTAAETVVDEGVAKPMERWFRDGAQRELYSKVSKSKPIPKKGVTIKTKPKVNRKTATRNALDHALDQQVIKAKGQARQSGTSL